MPHLAHIALVVRDYVEALAFYVGKLGFELIEDKFVGASALADAQGPRELNPRRTSAGS